MTQKMKRSGKLAILLMILATLFAGCDALSTGDPAEKTAEKPFKKAPGVGTVIPTTPPQLSSTVLFRKKGLTVLLLEPGETAEYACAIVKSDPEAEDGYSQINLGFEFPERLQTEHVAFVPYALYWSDTELENYVPDEKDIFLKGNCAVPQSQEAVDLFYEVLSTASWENYESVARVKPQSAAANGIHMNTMLPDPVRGCDDSGSFVTGGGGDCQVGDGGGIGVTAPRPSPPPLPPDWNPPPPPTPDRGNGDKGSGGSGRGPGYSPNPPQECVMPDGDVITYAKPLSPQEASKLLVVTNKMPLPGDDPYEGQPSTPQPCSKETVKKKRLEELAKLLKRDRDKLICGKTHQDLATHEVPQSVVDRLEDISWDDDGDGFVREAMIQSLEEASGPTLHTDEYTVSFRESDLPNGMSADNFFDKWRQEANFSQPHAAHFEFYSSTEQRRWNRGDYLGTIISIDLMAFGVRWIEDGTIVVTGVGDNDLIFSAAWSQRDHRHPITGNRQFFMERRNGRVFMGTRSSNRITAWDYSVANFLSRAIRTGGLTYNGSKVTWLSMQDILADKLSDLGVTEISRRDTQQEIDWDNVKKYVETGNKSALNCK